MALIGYPDGQMASRPNQFASNSLGATSTQTSTTGLVSTGAFSFGFNAALMKVVVDSAGPAYVQLNGNVATTNDYKLTTGDLLSDWYDLGAGFSGISIAATSTSISWRVGAWG